ncbi:MAG: GAF domain-containing protein [Chloroflexia bacterium]|nr:GAF domain-containing protein [Chloroflexia bacterium]
MTEEQIALLQRQLTLKQRELDMILAIDRIRDSASEPPAMLEAIVNAIADQIGAELCLLCLLDHETGELELKAVNERYDYFGQLEPALVRQFARWALQSEGVVVWREGQAPDVLGHTRPPENLQLAATPIWMGEEQLGALLLARSRQPFDRDDVALLKAAESQMDSAVVQAYAHYELHQRNLELETIYRVDRIRDMNLPFDDMLNAALQELSGVIQAEMGFVLLYDPVGRRLELRAVTHDDLFRVSPYYEAVNRVANEALQKAEMVCYNDLEPGIRSVMCIPLILHEEIIGVLGVANRYGPAGFRQHDRRLLSAIASQMDTTIFESLERRRLRQVLGRSVDPHVLERLLAAPDVDFLEGERSELSVLYADLRESTYLAEHTDPELLVDFINDYLSQMTEVILAHEGTLDKFVGDEVMALFGAPFARPDHALRAVQAGLEMQRVHQTVVRRWRDRGIEASPIGVGIASGELIVGEIGCARRTDYTVIGRAANLGSRICNAAAAGQVLVSEATYQAIRERVQATPVHGLRFKGIEGEVTVYHVRGLLG